MGITRQRNEILRIVKNYDGHPTAENVYECSRNAFPNIGRGTVYRNLNILADNGEIRRVQMPNEPVRFDKTASPHDHMLCVKCGTLIDFDLAQPDFKAALPNEAKVLRYALFVYGICPECLKGFKYPELS